MAGTTTHAPTHDRQAEWDDQQADERVAHVRPLVEDFAANIHTDLDSIALADDTRGALADLLLATS